MALGFFYRHQKMVFIIMAVLMVSFLIGYQGFNLLFSREPGKQVVGETRYGELRGSDIWSAEKDIRVVRLFDRHPRQQRLALEAMRLGAGPEAQRALQLRELPDPRVMTHPYALLLAEARQSGVRVLDSDVENFLARRGYTGEKLDELLAEARRFDKGITLDRIKAGIANWLRIYKSYHLAHLPDADPTEQELRLTYRDTFEKVALKAAVVPAEDFRDDIPPTRRTALRSDERVREQFAGYRDVAPGTYDDETELSEAFGFGYRWAEPRVRLLYAVVDKHTVARALGAEPGVEVVAAALKDIAAAVGDALGDYAAEDPYPRDVLDYFAERGLIGDAGDLLQRELHAPHIVKVPLDEALAKLATRTKPPVQAVVLPHGADWIDADAEVSLIGATNTLGEALDALVAQAVEDAGEDDEPAWKWVTFRGLGNAVFCVPRGAGAWSLPVSRPVATRYAMRRDFFSSRRRDLEPLASAATAAKQHITQLVFPQDDDDGAEEAVVGAGEAGQDLTTFDGGRLIVWRVLAAAPAGAPEELTPDIRRRVENDLLTTEAFKLATDFARDLRDAAVESGLAEAAEQAESVEIVEIEPFARKRWTGLPSGFPRLLWNHVPELTGDAAPPEPIHRKLMEAVFELAGPDAPELKLVPFAPAGKVFVLSRSAYEPPARDEYAEQRPTLVKLLRAIGTLRATLAHFDVENIVQRTGFRRPTP
ncbi:MAG: hypothetical protein ACOC8F_08355 [Planctomycetota bacterium]